MPQMVQLRGKRVQIGFFFLIFFFFQILLSNPLTPFSSQLNGTGSDVCTWFGIECSDTDTIVSEIVLVMLIFFILFFFFFLEYSH